MAEYDNGLRPQTDISDKNISSIIYKRSDIEEAVKEEIKSVIVQKLDIESIEKTSINAITIAKEKIGKNLVLYM